VSYTDTNHDGIIEPNEVTIEPVRFYGPSYPKTQLTTTARVSFLDNHLSVSAQFDYRGGFRLVDYEQWTSCFYQSCRAANVRGTSLAEQASAVANETGNIVWGPLTEDGSFIRFRELSITYSLPAVFTHSIVHVRTASVTLSGRNLALWTKFTGVDPETNGSFGTTSFGPLSSTGGLPPAQYWLIRINLGI
jgi:hypothetical protein